MDLNFKIENQILKRSDKNEVVNFSENYLKLNFEFLSKDWETVDKYILIYQDDPVYHEKNVIRLSLSNENSVTLSSQFLRGTKFVFLVYGEIVENSKVTYRITTNQHQVNLINCNFTKNYDGNLDPEEDADIVEQLWSAINLKADEADLSTVATSGEYSDLKHIPETFTPTSHTHTSSEITDFPELAPVATSGNYGDLDEKPDLFSGSYNDLTDKPTIPTVVQTVQNGNTNAVSSDAVYDFVYNIIGSIQEDMMS